jgi:hypothetical protein
MRSAKKTYLLLQHLRIFIAPIVTKHGMFMPFSRQFVFQIVAMLASFNNDRHLAGNSC